MTEKTKTAKQSKPADPHCTPGCSAHRVEDLIARHEVALSRELHVAWAALHASRVYAESLGQTETAATLRALADALAPFAAIPVLRIPGSPVLLCLTPAEHEAVHDLVSAQHSTLARLPVEPGSAAAANAAGEEAVLAAVLAKFEALAAG